MMDLKKVKEIAEELLEGEEFERSELLPGYGGFVTLKPDPLVRATILGHVYLAEVVADGLALIAERLVSLER